MTALSRCQNRHADVALESRLAWDETSSDRARREASWTPCMTYQLTEVRGEFVFMLLWNS